MVIYKDTLDDITPGKLTGFFDGWKDPPSPDTHFQILKNSSHFILAIDEDTDSVIGFINTISDNILSAYIPLLEVLPSYRGKGIGSELVKQMLKKLDGLYMIDITCDPGLQPFYGKFNLTPSTGMFKRNYFLQSGKKL